MKIYKYECRRLLWNKFFFGIGLVLLFYGWQVLNRVTILGVSRTAPFSPWSFGDYLSRILPLLWAGALFFLSFFTSVRAKRADILTDATPVTQWKYGLARCGAAMTGTGLLTLLCLGEAFVFYGWYFNWYQWEILLPTAAAALIPPLVLGLGSGWLLGRCRPWLLYVWMLFPFVCRVLPLPKALGLWDGRFFTEYPQTLGILDPVFSMPASVIAVQLLAFAAGVLLLVFNRPSGRGTRRF